MFYIGEKNILEGFWGIKEFLCLIKLCSLESNL
jgi:hypothetical protein